LKVLDSEESFWGKSFKNKYIKNILLIIIIVSMLFGNVVWANEVNKECKPKDLKNVSYPEVGLTTSLLLISPNLGYWFGPIGIRLSGMYLNENNNEVHFNLGYKLSDNGKTQQSINLLSGVIVGSDPGADYNYTYLGVAYGLNFSIKKYRGFFIEIGIAKVLHDHLGNLKDDPFVPCGTFGYIYRFTP